MLIAYSVRCVCLCRSLVGGLMPDRGRQFSVLNLAHTLSGIHHAATDWRRWAEQTAERCKAVSVLVLKAWTPTKYWHLRWLGWVVSLRPQPLYSWVEHPGCSLNRRLNGPQSSLLLGVVLGNQLLASDCFQSLQYKWLSRIPTVWSLLLFQKVSNFRFFKASIIWEELRENRNETL